MDDLILATDRFDDLSRRSWEILDQ